MLMKKNLTCAIAATIAVRYATVRRQGNKSADGLEVQIINYPAVYNRLLPLVSRAYTFILLSRNLVRRRMSRSSQLSHVMLQTRAFSTMASRLANGDTSLLAEMHATTSGLKVLCTTAGIQDVETARRCLGGHGYSEVAGVGRLYALVLPSATYVTPYDEVYHN